MVQQRQTRNTERTRRAILDAATQVILERGSSATLAQIATAAGVSKSGLIHHFGSRDELIGAVVEDVNERFRGEVLRHLDLSENHPGKMLRAYVRALCAGSTEAVAARDLTSTLNWNGLYALPSVAAVMAEQDAMWSARFAEDGLTAERIQIVRRAAEGVAFAAVHGDEDEAGIESARRSLLQLASNGTFEPPL